MRQPCIAVMALTLAWAARGQGVFDVHEFGATGDGKSPDTAAIQKALDQCGNAGGGLVRIPPGTYLSGPLFLHSKTTLRLEAGATLRGTDVPGDYLKPERKDEPVSSRSFNALINGRNLEDVTIDGTGTIDGAGARWWVPAEAARRKTPGFTMPRPRLILISNSKNLRVLDVTLRNSPSFHFVPTDCENVVVSNVTIVAPANSPNTDAIDPSACKNVLITKCRIDVGDDDVAIKSGHKVRGRDIACEDIVVTDCSFLHGHGMSIGSETLGGVRNVRVKHCTFENTENGIRIKSQRGKGGLVEDVEYSDITMTNVNPAVTFTCYYMNNSARDPAQRLIPENDSAQPVAQGTPVFRNIRITGLTATCENSAGIIIGLPESAISNVVFENARISAVSGLKIENAADIQTKGLRVETQEGGPFLVRNAQVLGLSDGK